VLWDDYRRGGYDATRVAGEVAKLISGGVVSVRELISGRVFSRRFSQVSLTGLTLVVSLLFLAANASAATRTWDGGCGAETAWSCAANWSENTVPGAADIATFSTTSTGNSTVDASFAGTVGSVAINAGYTGTVSLSRSLTVAAAFTQISGSFNAGSQALTLKTVTLKGGTFTASSGTTSVSGALKIAGGSYEANGGTLNFNGGGAMLNCGGATFNLVTFTNTSGTKNVDSNCTMPLGKNPNANSGGSINLNGTLSGTGTLMTAGTLTLGTTGKLSGLTGLAARNLTVKGSYDFGAYEPFTVSGPFMLTAGASFKAPSKTASFGKNFTLSSGATFDANGGTINFNSKTSFKVICGSQTFNSVAFTSSGHKNIAGDCTLPLGKNPSLGTAGGTTLNGTLSGSGTLTQIGTFEIGSESPGLDAFTDVIDNGSFLLLGEADVTAPEGTLRVQGNFTIGASSTFDANEGTVNFQALPKTTKTITCNEAEFNLVEFTNTSKQVVGGDCTLPLGAGPKIGEGGQIVLNGNFTGTGTLTANSLLFTLGSTGDLSGFSGLASDALLVEGTQDFGSYTSFTAGGDFTIAAGAEFTAPEATAKFAGDFVNGGAFDANEGAVELTGTNQALTGSTTFEDLTKVVKAVDTLTFPAGAAQTVEGTLTLEGASAEKLLSLASSSPGTVWGLAGTGSRSAKWLSVADSENTGTEISADESFDAGKNSGWSFP
jgi:hypothetical protein